MTIKRQNKNILAILYFHTTKLFAQVFCPYYNFLTYYYFIFSYVCLLFSIFHRFISFQSITVEKSAINTKLKSNRNDKCVFDSQQNDCHSLRVKNIYIFRNYKLIHN